MSTMEPGPEMAEHIHTIPVDPSFEGTEAERAREAFKELCIFGRRVTVTGPPRWANVLCAGGCENLMTETTGP